MYMKPCQTFLTFLVNSSSLNVVVFLLEAKTSVGVKQVNMLQYFFLSTCCNHLFVNILQSFFCQHAAIICWSTRCNHLFVNMLQTFVCQHAAIICLSTCCNHLYVNMLHYDIFLGDFLRQD